MAFIDNVTYNGEYAADLISPLFFGNTIFTDFTIRDGVKGKITIGKLGISGHVQPDSCGWDQAGSIQLDPRELSVCSFKVNEEFCYEDLEASFLSARLRAGAANSFGPTEFTTKLTSELIDAIGNTMQNVLWNGDAGATSGPPYLNQCDGLIVIAGATGQNVIGLSGTAISSTNVLAELNRVVVAIPATLKNRGIKPVIYAAQNVVDAYLFSQVNTAGGLVPSGEKIMDFMGYQVKAAPFLPSNKMFAFVPSNVNIGTDLLSDMTSVGVREIIDERLARVYASWKFGVQIGILAEVVYYY